MVLQDILTRFVVEKRIFSKEKVSTKLRGRLTMEDLKGRKAKIRVDHLAKKNLRQGDVVEIVDQWEEFLVPGNPSQGKRRKLIVRSLRPPDIVEEIDETDVIIMD